MSWKKRFAAAVAGVAMVAGAGPALASQSGAQNGGTLIVTWSSNPQTIDPRKIYNGEDWNIGAALYEGLYMPREDNSLQPMIAASLPKISNGGTVYTIKLRHGIKWSNGKPVTAQDFVYSLRTELASSFQSPDDYLWYMVKGAADYEAGKSKLLGVKALDDYTLQYTLSKPFTAFPYVLVTPASFPVFSGAASQVSTNPVTNGPYVVQSWTKGVKLILKKNPNFKQSQPYPDNVEMDFNVDPSVGIMRVESGQADLVGDGIPAADFLTLKNNPQYASNIAREFSPAVVMLALNTKVKPFDNQKVRQAVEMAINKQHLVQLLNGRGQVANEILPTSLPGFQNSKVHPFKYDPTSAKRLLKEAGYPNGFTTELGMATEQANGTNIATEVQSDLDAIGIKVSIKPLPQEASAMAEVPMLTYSWYQDYPDPSDFMDGFVTSAPVVGGSNPAFLNDKALNDMAHKADGVPLGPKRVSYYEALDQRAMMDAAYVPLFYPELTDFHSSRVQNYPRPAFYFPMQYNFVWLKQ